MPESSDGQSPAANSSGATNNEPNSTQSGGGNTRSSRRNNRRNRRGMRPKEEPFEGECADLKGAVFDLTENKSYFAETCRKIYVYVGRNLKDAMDYRLALQGRDMPNIKAPQRPPFGAPDEDFKEYEERRLSLIHI